MPPLPQRLLRRLLATAVSIFAAGTAIAAPTDSLISYWQFENNTADQSAVGSVVDDGSWVGSSSYAPGVHGTGIRLRWIQLHFRAGKHRRRPRR